MQRAVTKWTQHLLLFALVAWPQLSPGAPLQADTSASQFVIRAGRDGLLAAFAHDHEFSPARWQAEVDFDPARPQELRVDVQTSLSSIDARALIEAMVRRVAPTTQPALAAPGSEGSGVPQADRTEDPSVADGPTL